MKIKNKKTRLKLMIVSIVALFALGVVIFAFLGGFGSSQTNNSDKTTEPQTSETAPTSKETIDNTAPSDAQAQSGQDIKKNSVDSSSSSSTPTSNKTESVGVVITKAAPDGSNFIVRAYVDTVVATGNCTLVMTSGNNSVPTKTVGVSAGPQISGCKDFEIPLSSLPSGTWSIKVSFKNDTKEGSTTTTRDI